MFGSIVEKMLIDHSTSHKLLRYFDSLLLRNPQLRQAPNRYAQAVGTTKINLFLASLFIIFVV